MGTIKFILYFIFLSLTYLFTIDSFAQSSPQDSFRKVLQLTRNDKEQVNKMLQFAEEILDANNRDSISLYWIAQAEKKASQIDYPYGIGKAHILRGDYYFENSAWNNSIQSYKAALETAVRIPIANDKNEVRFNGLNNLAEVYNYNGDYVTALDHRLKALALVDSIDADASKKTSAYVSVANDFRHLNQRTKAIEYLDKAKQILTNANDHLKLDFYYEYYQNLLLNDQVTESLKLLAKFDSGVSTFNLTAAQKLEFSGIGHKLHGQYELNYTRNFPAAVFHFQQYHSYSMKLGNKTHIAIALNKLGIAYDSSKQYQQAIAAFRESYDICMKENVIDYGYKSAQELSMIYDLMGDHLNAYRFSNIAYRLKDTLAMEEKLQELNFLEAKYEATQKEKEIADLSVENAKQELLVVKRNRTLLIGGIIASAIMLILGLMYRNSKNKFALAEKEKLLQAENIRFLERQQQVVSLQSMINGQEAERTRIAKDLHDGLGGLFSTVKMYFSTLEHQEQQLKQNELFKKSISIVDTAATEVRRIAHNMMPEVLMKMGLVNALGDLCNNVSAGRQVKVSFQHSGMEERLSQSTEIMLYRIIQELLNNIVKHAEAKQAIVQFIRDGNRLSVTVEDDGKGYDVAGIEEAGHAGLESVKSRVSYLNGKWNVDSQKEVGTTVMMDFLVSEMSES